METPTTQLSFAEAFDRDLQTHRMEQSQVSALLSRGDTVPMSSAAISNWKKRDRVPLRRLDMLVELFGPDSATAGYARRQHEERPQFSRRLVAKPIPANYYHFAEEVPSRLITSRVVETTQVHVGSPSEREEALAGVPPDDLRKHSLPGIKIYGRVYRFDYVSPKLAISTRVIRSPASMLPMSVARTIVRLQLLRSVSPSGQVIAAMGWDDAFARTYTLVLVTPDPATLRETREYLKVKQECSLLEIDVICVPDFESAAKYITDTERTAARHRYTGGLTP